METSMSEQAITVIPHIIDQHAEEAAFLWLLRHDAVAAPHYDLNDLARLDDRVEAHLDGLRIAGDYGWQVCSENMLQIQEPGEVFAAAVLALEGKSGEHLQLVYDTAETVPESITGLVSAFGWIDPHNLKGTVNDLLRSANSYHKRIGLAACAIHRVDPGGFLAQAIGDDDIDLKCRALKAVGELGRADLNSAVLKQLNHEQADIRFWAAWSAVLTGDRSRAVDVLRYEIEAGSGFSAEAMQLAIPALDSQSINTILKVLADNPDTLRQAIIGAGIAGDPNYIHWLIQHMSVPDMSRVAGEAFSHICGVDLAYQDMEGELPEEARGGPTENPEDDNVAMDPDEDLACPDPQLVQQWWQEHQQNFQPGVRYLYGKPADTAQCQWLLRTGTQRLRYAAALTLALMQPGQVLFEVRDVGKRQQAALGQ